MQKNGCNGNVNIDVHARQGGPPKDLPGLRPYSHESGDFCIRKFFYADTKISVSTRTVYESYTTVHTYPIRIRTSQRISQHSMCIKTGSDTVTSAYTKIYGYERPHVSGYTAYTEISTLESLYRNPRIHRAYTADTCGRYVYLHKKKIADTKISGYVWTGPE